MMPYYFLTMLSSKCKGFESSVVDVKDIDEIQFPVHVSRSKLDIEWWILLYLPDIRKNGHFDSSRHSWRYNQMDGWMDEWMDDSIMYGFCWLYFYFVFVGHGNWGNHSHLPMRALRYATWLTLDIPIVTAIATTSEAPDMVLSASRGMYQKCYYICNLSLTAGTYRQVRYCLAPYSVKMHSCIFNHHQGY